MFTEKLYWVKIANRSAVIATSYTEAKFIKESVLIKARTHRQAIEAALEMYPTTDYLKIFWS